MVCFLLICGKECSYRDEIVLEMGMGSSSLCVVFVNKAFTIANKELLGVTFVF